MQTFVCQLSFLINYEVMSGRLSGKTFVTMLQEGVEEAWVMSIGMHQYQ